MGNMACVPQAPGRFRYSFSRKPSLRKEQESKKKLAGLFGFEPGQERDVSSDKILQYIPGKNLTAQENEKENFDQRFPGLFKKGRRKTVVRNLGKIIYYSKVKFKFQHSQELIDCYLELFQAYLYFQSLGPNGLTYQGLLPLKELQLNELENPKGSQEEVYAFQITGPLLNPLIVYCPNKSEVKRWLYHLEKQIHLNGGNLDLPFLTQNEWKQGSAGREQLRWSVQNAPVQEWRGTQRESLGDILCVSKVQLQHLPFQEAHDRLLILYPSTLVIVSEERNGLYFKGELPLNAIQVQFEENQKTSFLIEGRLINSIRVICPSYEDYQEWLYCLKTAQFRNVDSSLSGSESFSGPKAPHLTQFSGSGRGSLTSDGRTNSWASGGKGATSTHHSQNSTGSLSEKQSFGGMPENRLADGPMPQASHCLGNPASTTTGIAKPELKRKGSSRKSKGKCGLQKPQPSSQDSERSHFQLIPEHASGEVLSPVYNEPYTALAQQQQPPSVPPLHLDLNNLKQWNLPRCQNCTAAQNRENTPPPCSPMYADPYTPNSPSSHGAADSNLVEEFMRRHGQSALEHQNGYPAMPVTVPITHHPPAQKKNCQALPGNHWREPTAAQRCSPALNYSAMPPSDTDYLTASTLSRDREELPMPSLPTSDKGIGTYDLPESGRERLDSAYHDYAELQSFQSDFSYDNIWDMETKDNDIYHC
ncbi:LOW QUALITY PROTEIN: pleckstrin homology domain-containing family N member 1 [Sceloporus undulatus]|uniref:LOW QUALITY PROTEIN: pleckstrin homology domain-containing family N member 1 n=1 Tax=Sceloporus undulatus TaxID=8520 RepID=UPI001C4B7214|nr:LOW QUALITY PROTEIN: pleckstrin homology domain-containing family N member 1 [Sceloporus undulatus]